MTLVSTRSMAAIWKTPGGSRPERPLTARTSKPRHSGRHWQRRFPNGSQHTGLRRRRVSENIWRLRRVDLAAVTGSTRLKYGIRGHDDLLDVAGQADSIPQGLPSVLYGFIHEALVCRRIPSSSVAWERVPASAW